MQPNIFACSDHFEGKYFDKPWDLQNRFFSDRPIKRKLISTAMPFLLTHQQISKPRENSRAKQKEKEEVKHFSSHGSKINGICRLYLCDSFGCKKFCRLLFLRLTSTSTWFLLSTNYWHIFDGNNFHEKIFNTFFETFVKNVQLFLKN